MKSVLLGGLRVWLVNDGGKPLSAPGGRAKFFKAGTSTPETVYSDINLTQATALGPVVHTDELGYLPPIWLKTDRLYKVRIEQKIPGTPEQWALLWEVDNVGYVDPHESEEPGEPTISVNSISELKTVDHSAHTVAMVLGYYSAGDWGEPSIFVFDPECTKAPDDGAYVLPSDQQQSVAGRWVQVFSGDILDVRKFGALPDMTDNSDVSAKVVNAVHYSQDNSTRTRPVTVGFVAPGRYDFIGDFNFAQYSFTDLTDQSVYQVPWFIGNGVYFNGNGQFILSKCTECRAGGKLYSGTSSLAVEGGGYIEVDPAWWGDDNCSVADCYVKCGSVTTNTKVFVRCKISSERKLGGTCSFQSCKITEDMFTSSSMTPVVDSSCVFDLDDFHTVAMWLRIKDQLPSTDYDMKMRMLDSSCTISKNNVYLKNAVLDGFSYASSYGITVDGCTGSFSLSVSGTASVLIKDSTVSVAINSVGSTSLAIYNSTVQNTYSVSTSVETLYVKSSRFSGTGLSTSGNLTAYDSVLQTSSLGCGGMLDIERCRVDTPIAHANRVIVNSVLKDNLFTRTYGVSATVSDSVFTGIICGNHSTAIPAISVDRTNFNSSDSSHTYSYEGNTGTFPKDSYSSWKEVTVYYRNLIYNHDGTTPEETDPLSLCRYYKSGYMYVLQRNGHKFDTAELFRVGSDSFDMVMELEVSAGNADDGVYSKVLFSATLVAGNTWNIAPSRLQDDSDYASPTVVSRDMPTSESEPSPAVYTRRYLIRYRKA